MVTFPENKSEQGDNSTAIPVVSLGKMLREARERLGLSVADIAAQIKFAPRQIESLEADDFMRLPEAAFLRGFVRSYAKILQLDAQTLLEALPQSKATNSEPISASANVPFPDVQTSQRQNQILLGAALLIAVLVAVFAAWHFTSPIKQPGVAKTETPVALPAELPVVTDPQTLKQDTIEPKKPAEPKARPLPVAEKPSSQPAKPAPVPAVQKIKPMDAKQYSDSATNIVKLHMLFDVESWAEIKDRDGNTLSARVHEPGSEMRLGGKPPLTLVVGRAGSVHLFKNGEPVDLKPFINSSSEVARLTLE